METIKEFFGYYKKLTRKQKFKFLFAAPIAMLSVFVAMISDKCNNIVCGTDEKIQDTLRNFMQT